jgi:hypothetical protein
MKHMNVTKDPRLTFLNFDFLKTSDGKIVKVYMFPIAGLLKFINEYLGMTLEAHLFRDIDFDDVTRRSLDELHPLFDSNDGFGFISWLNIVLKYVINVFTVTELNSGTGVKDYLANSRISTSSDDGVVKRQHSFKSFTSLENDWFRKHGDIGLEEFDNQIHHGFISIVLYETWANIFGCDANFESESLQRKKMSDKFACTSQKRDLDNSSGFCRPCWMTPISHKHFTERSHFLLALATSTVLEVSVPFDWPEGFEDTPSILGSFQCGSSFGYPTSTANLKPSVDDVKEAVMFESLTELLIQKMYFEKLKKEGTLYELTANAVLEEIINDPILVRDQFQDFFVEESLLFASCLSYSGQHTWPKKLAQAHNRNAAVLLIERKILHWNIISVFDPSNPLYYNMTLNFSRTQIPILKRCLIFALVDNWGGLNGLGREIRVSQLRKMLASISDALTGICQISLDIFPTFVQRLFAMFEAPKSGSNYESDFKRTGSLFLNLHQALERNQTSTISQICDALENSTSSPKSRLKYLQHVGDFLFRRDPSTWSHMDSFSRISSRTINGTDLRPTRSASMENSDAISKLPLSSAQTGDFVVGNSKYLTGPVLNIAQVKQIIQSTVETNQSELLFRFLGVQEDRSGTNSDGHCFFGMSSIANSTNRNIFPQQLHKMVYNVISVIGSHSRLSRGVETNALILSSLKTIVQIIYAGACISLDECKSQLSKLSRCKPVLDQQDGESLFARVSHVQECLVGLRWRSSDEFDYQKIRNTRDSNELYQNPVPVTDPSHKVALRTMQYIAQLTTPSSPTLDIRIEALRALVCILDSCSALVLDQFLRDTQLIQSTANTFALTLADCIKDYERFNERDDILVLGLKEFQDLHSNEQLQDEFVRLLIEIESTDPSSVLPCIRQTFDNFCNEGYTLCMYALRLIEQLCVLSGKMTRTSYIPGQVFLEMQPNSDPAMVVNFQSLIVSLGSKISSRFRIGNANAFDVRVLNRVFKSLNSLMFGQTPSKMKAFLVPDTYVLVNRTVAGLSQRIDDIQAHYFPEIHPIHVFESLLKFLMTLVLSDIDGTCCKAVGKGVSWMSLFSLVSQVHSASSKFLKMAGPINVFSSRISVQEYRAVSSRIGDAAYILFSSIKRQDIAKRAQLEKDWTHANLQAVSAEASKRVSCVEIVRQPGCPELCFFPNPETLDIVSDETQRKLLCVEESRQLSLRKNLVLCEHMRANTNASSGFGPRVLKKIRNLPLILSTLINLLLLGWLNLPVDFSQADKGWKWPQEKLSWELLFPENGTYSYDTFQNEILPNVLPLFISDDSPYGIEHKRAVNMTFLLLTVFNVLSCFVLLVGWLWFESSAAVYQYLLTAAYEHFVSPNNQSKKKISLEELQQQASGKNYLHIVKIPLFWGYIVMFAASICILLVSPLFSILFVCDGFRFDGIAYIFGAFLLKAKEFATLGYLAASIIFLNTVIGLVFFWDLFAPGDGGSSECTSLFQCTLAFIVQGIGGISDFFTKPKDTSAGAPYQFGSDKPASYRQILSLMWQLLYFIVVPTCLVATVTGVIVDSFGNARQKQVDWKEKMRSECFVCGLSAADFRDANMVGHVAEEAIVTFQDHVNFEHCVKDYFKLFMRLKSMQVSFAISDLHFVFSDNYVLSESGPPLCAGTLHSQ